MAVKNKFALEFAQRESNEFLKTLWSCLRKEILWVSHPEDIRGASHKMHQLITAKKLGFDIPDTIVTNNPDTILSFYEKHGGNIVNKVLNRGYVDYNDGIFSLIYTNRVSKDELQKSVKSIKINPCLFQEYIPKLVELRITVVGSIVFAAEIHSQNSQRTKDDWRRYDLEHTPHFAHKLPANIESLCRKMVKGYNLNFGTIDMIVTPENKYIFLELNPNGQWMWIEELTKLPISEALVSLLAGES
jgi:glutathione synthase/RimK-type ligase-like ATP-grasp enzyme